MPEKDGESHISHLTFHICSSEFVEDFGFNSMPHALYAIA